MAPPARRPGRCSVSAPLSYPIAGRSRCSGRRQVRCYPSFGTQPIYVVIALCWHDTDETAERGIGPYELPWRRHDVAVGGRVPPALSSKECRRVCVEHCVDHVVVILAEP